MTYRCGQCGKAFASKADAELCHPVGGSTPSAESPRAAFERVHAGAAKTRDSTLGDYVYPSVRDAWAGWEACWNYLRGSTPSPDALREAARAAYAAWFKAGNDWSSLNEAMERLDAALTRTGGEPVAREHRLAAAIVWALGYTDFRSRREGEGAYWWRTELADRSGLTNEECNAIAAIQGEAADPTLGERG
jgi:hypothetical protein